MTEKGTFKREYAFPYVTGSLFQVFRLFGSLFHRQQDLSLGSKSGEADIFCQHWKTLTAAAPVFNGIGHIKDDRKRDF